MGLTCLPKILVMVIEIRKENLITLLGIKIKNSLPSRTGNFERFLYSKPRTKLCSNS